MNNPFTSRQAAATDLSRRWFLKDCGIGLGSIAMTHLLAESNFAALPKMTAPLDPLAVKKPHFPAKAKNVIYLFMGGGPSHLEMFDNKPLLKKFDGTLPPADLLKGYRSAFINPNSALLGPKFAYKKHGQSGTELSELLPNLASVVDDIAVIKSMKTDAFNHAPAQILMSTGNTQFGKPSLGAWATYGLGCETRDLPAFVVLNSGSKGPSGGAANWGSGFLPTVHSGVPFRSTGDPVLFLSNPSGVDPQLQQDSLDTINQLNRIRQEKVGDPEISTRINSFEMAYRMQSSAPELMDLSDEPQHLLELYGAKPGEASFANNCLLARRMIERGVRFVELFHESWDQHGGLVKNMKKNCADTEQACAALIKDLKQRGLLDDTLIVWGGEFGRTPMVQGSTDGRDHHPNAFSMWLAGGGIKGGLTYGETDDFGFNTVENPVHVRDLHATILHLLGFNHERLNFSFQGLDQRLTGVEPAHVVHDLIA
ncbi:MAG: DUF1501 domain-containing protein [Verrucomicrobiales bacterium]|nr:DUF1501 domain-containing protein [Verrucomicrobiales bacterium]